MRSDTTAENVEERCRQMRNVAPESVHQARRAWAGRSLTAWRNDKRGTLRLTVEVPIDEGELILRAIDCAVAAGEVTTDVDPRAMAESKNLAWRAQQADALVAVMKSYLTPVMVRKAGRRRITIKSSCMPTRNPCGEGRGARTCRSRP